MPAETFYTLIARNKRNSVILIAVFMLFFAAMGLLIGYAWSSYFVGHSSVTPPVTYHSYGQPSPGPEAEPTRPARPVPQERPARQDQHDWNFAIAVAVGAAGIAFILTLISYYGGASAILSMSQAHEVSQQDDPQLWNVVQEMAIAGGLPMPRVYIIEDTAMNALATGRDPKHSAVAVTRGLRDKLTRDELQAVIAHEMSHVRHYDIRYAMLMAVMVGVLVMLCDVFLRSFWYGGRRSSRSSSQRGGNPLQIVLIVIAIILAIVAPILAKIIELALSRQREYMADAGGVELALNPQALASALAKVSGDEEVLEVANRATAPLFFAHPIKEFESRASSIFDSHPPIRERIKRIMQLGT